MLLLLFYGDGSDPVVAPPVIPSDSGSRRLHSIAARPAPVDREDDDLFIVRIL